MTFQLHNPYPLPPGKPFQVRLRRPQGITICSDGPQAVMITPCALHQSSGTCQESLTAQYRPWCSDNTHQAPQKRRTSATVAPPAIMIKAHGYKHITRACSPSGRCHHQLRGCGLGATPHPAMCTTRHPVPQHRQRSRLLTTVKKWPPCLVPGRHSQVLMTHRRTSPRIPRGLRSSPARRLIPRPCAALSTPCP